MVVVFILGYTAIALEHPLKIDKAASALLTGVLLWAIYILAAESILPNSDAYKEFLHLHPHETYINFIAHHEITFHLGEISQILFFLLGAMTIVEMVDTHEGFRLITDKIKTTNKVKLMWILSFLTFFMSAALDNLTTTIVMVALLRKLIDKQQDRWFMASMVVLAANAGGAWSPIGDVTTIMLWIGGQVTTVRIIIDVILPSFVTMIVPRRHDASGSWSRFHFFAFWDFFKKQFLNAAGFLFSLLKKEDFGLSEGLRRWRHATAELATRILCGVCLKAASCRRTPKVLLLRRVSPVNSELLLGAGWKNLCENSNPP